MAEHPHDERTPEHDQPEHDPSEEKEEEREELGPEAPALVEKATNVGAARLRRPLMPEAVTALVGGMSISFGGVAMAIAGGLGHELGGEALGRLLGALFFPIGFVILLIGKSELFTENFLLPVTGVLEHRAPVRSLLRVWAVSLVFNLVGAAIFAWLIGRPGVLEGAAAEHLRTVATQKLSMPWGEAFVRAIFAGWLMTVLTWLLLACDTVGPRLAIMWMIAAMIVLGRFNHAIISAAEVFMAWQVGLPRDVGHFVVAEFVPAALGNLTGGVVFVTALHYLQARGLREGKRRENESNGRTVH